MDKKMGGDTKQVMEKSEDMRAETRQQVDELRVDGNVMEEVKVETTTAETFKIKKPVKGM